MTRTVLSLAVAFSVVAGAALAGSTGPATSIDFSNLSVEQLDALANVLTGLPRQ